MSAQVGRAKFRIEAVDVDFVTAQRYFCLTFQVTGPDGDAVDLERYGIVEKIYVTKILGEVPCVYMGIHMYAGTLIDRTCVENILWSDVVYAICMTTGEEYTVIKAKWYKADSSHVDLKVENAKIRSELVLDPTRDCFVSIMDLLRMGRQVVVSELDFAPGLSVVLDRHFDTLVIPED
jgi:hypothetical protein